MISWGTVKVLNRCLRVILFLLHNWYVLSGGGVGAFEFDFQVRSEGGASGHNFGLGRETWSTEDSKRLMPGGGGGGMLKFWTDWYIKSTKIQGINYEIKISKI